MSDLCGLTTVVTGSSSGIGRAIALEFAAAGAAVIVHAHTSRDAAEDTAMQVRRLGADATVVLADVADERAAERLVDEAWAWRSGIDVWVNNAGADTLTGEAGKWPFERKLSHLWQVDVRGTILLSRLVGTKMRAAGHGTILNMGWDQAARGMAGDSGELFATSKGAIMAFTKSLARSLAPEVRVNCLAPGWIKTAWGDQASEYWQERAAADSWLGRWGTPEDVARAARFLASPAASFITGQIFAVNGGN
jgi:3-oxoacyl-[acyl-carrier protein] reductase